VTVNAFEILTPPVGEPISLGRIKIQIRMEAAFTDEDEYLSELICAARERAESLTNRCFLTQTVRQYRNHLPGCHIPSIFDHRHERHHRHRKWELARSPVQEIVQVQYIDVNAATQTLPTSFYNSDLVLEPGTIYPAPCTIMPLTQFGVPNTAWVDYVVGYSDDDSKVPATLKAAMALMVAHWYTNREPVAQAGLAEIPMTATDLLRLNEMYYQA
jgi:uncharacterized phiE125 gp8 family phage protein